MDYAKEYGIEDANFKLLVLSSFGAAFGVAIIFPKGLRFVSSFMGFALGLGWAVSVIVYAYYFPNAHATDELTKLVFIFGGLPGALLVHWLIKLSPLKEEYEQSMHKIFTIQKTDR